MCVGHVAAVGNEDYVGSRRCEEERGEAGGDLRAEEVFRRLVYVADLDERVLSVDEGPELWEIQVSRRERR